ncbi:hypothetical protein BDV97DRAFT_348580 [Delphinella strobiligena]|nr:hypothetical protein BDV97DRAFT_348580 [Delphinella strobiligena]
MGPTSNTSEDSTASTWLMPEAVENEGLFNQGCWPPLSIDDVWSSCTGDTSFQTPVGSSFTRIASEGSRLEHPHISPTIHSTQVDQPTFRTTLANGACMNPSGEEGNAPSTAECDLRLCALSLQIGRQMQTHTVELQNMSQTGSSTDAIQFDSQFFGNALNSTSEFLTILQDFVCTGAEPPSAAPCHLRRVPSNHSRTGYGVIRTLNLLSAYLQLIALFDGLFHRLYDLLCNSSMVLMGPFAKGPGPDIQILPGLQLAGFHVRQGSFQTKVLIQAIQHQFEMIEKILGLPTKMRVSERQDVYSVSLLGDGLNQSLLNAVVSGDHDVEKSAACMIQHDGATGSLSSLRGNILNVKRYLDI